MDQPEALGLSPAIVTIFGVTGDLAHRKLLPSLYQLERQGLLHDKSRIVGIARRQVSAQELLDKARISLTEAGKSIDESVMARLAQKFEVYIMNAADDQDYPGLRSHLDAIEDQADICMNRLFYLAIPPQISMPIINSLGVNGLNQGCTRHGNLAHLLMEKPFGFDSNTAKELIDTTRMYFHEKQIFRIDHYLAKETVQNIVTFRFRNPIFADIWNNQHIAAIDIRADEKIDIEGRANFYEQVGALRDFVQNHLFHIMSVILMHRPRDITSSDDIHAMRQYALDHIEPVPAAKIDERVVRGQYSGYTDEVDNPRSETETFVALKLFSRDQAWQGVPIYVRSGKALAQKATYVTVDFKPQIDDDQELTNQLIFKLQPNEGIEIKLFVKKPGFARKLQSAPMRFSYDEMFSSHGHPDAYERVLVDAIRGDNTLFATSDQIMAAWRILQPVLDNWQSDEVMPMAIYAKGSDGPNLQNLT